uniref:Ubiquitin carboxyl-terminal hydrolase n=1 Tax=Chrysemys picta bellii TaxID=8478 RepID=A0A8C3FVA2_CHRPI|nr:ubiquitin carboxyl-terminal hydrolase MINDY-1 [Chrysemys picta bellii]XP_042699262.1 ubiquitin carboxyl-terminal hydrolase MINDY-1 [Chrysemys picta bellii]
MEPRLEQVDPMATKGDDVNTEVTTPEICQAPLGLEEDAAGMGDETQAAAGQGRMLNGQGLGSPKGIGVTHSEEAPSGQGSSSCQQAVGREHEDTPRKDPSPRAGPSDEARQLERGEPEGRADPKEKQPPPSGSIQTGGVDSPPDDPISSLSPGAAEQASDATKARPPAGEPEPDFYCVKWISWKGERTPIITQCENGPCPLLAIMNILFLQWKVKLSPQKEVITSDELMAHLGDCILSIKPQENSEGLQLNFQQNVNDAMMVLPKLSTGLDVNVRFTGVSDFEYTPECIVFDLLNVPLYHGWLVDPQSPDAAQAVGKLSYNQLVEKIITCKHSSDPNLVTEGLIAEQFLESTATQLTYHGLCELTAAVKEGELSVFFRNNHFSTMIKHQGHLYLLVTDQGFLQEEKVTWESLHNVDGDSCFCDAEFHLSHTLGKEAAGSSPQEQRQVDQDYMIALSLQQQQQGPSALSDLELARQLQQEEYQQQQQQPATPPAQGRAQPSGRPAGERRQRHKQESDCVLL